MNGLAPTIALLTAALLHVAAAFGADGLVPTSQPDSAAASGPGPTSRRAGPEPIVLSDHMTLAQIGGALDANPPDWKNADARHAIFASFDKLVTIRTNHQIGITDAQREALGPLIAFYRRRVDRGLKKLETTQVAEGVHMFKFYSSSFVLRSAEGSVLVDFAQGPVTTDRGDPETEDVLKSGFYWTPRQRQRLADQVDAMLITHRHFDHCDFSLAKLLIAQGKPVVAPPQVRDGWKDLLGAPGITAPNFDREQRVGPAVIRAMLGWQYSLNGPGPDGKHMAWANPDRPDQDSQTAVYLIKLGGVVFLNAAENHVPCEAWLTEAQKPPGWKVNVMMAPGQWQGAESTRQAVRNVLWLDGHEYEMTHPGAGQRLAMRLEGGMRRQYLDRKRLTLTWGEDMLLTGEWLKWTR